MAEDADLGRSLDADTDIRSDDVEHLDEDVVGDADPLSYFARDDEYGVSFATWLP